MARLFKSGPTEERDFVCQPNFLNRLNQIQNNYTHSDNTANASHIFFEEKQASNLLLFNHLSASSAPSSKSISLQTKKDRILKHLETVAKRTQTSSLEQIVDWYLRSPETFPHTEGTILFDVGTAGDAVMNGWTPNAKKLKS